MARRDVKPALRSNVVVSDLRGLLGADALHELSELSVDLLVPYWRNAVAFLIGRAVGLPKFRTVRRLCGAPLADSRRS